MSLESTSKPNNTDQNITLFTVTFTLGYLEFVQSSQGLLVWSGVCPEFTRLTGVVWSLHYSVMWYVVHIAQWGYQEFTLFIGVVKNSHCSLGLSRIHIVQWGYQEFTLFSRVIKNSHCSVGLSRIHIVQWGYQEFTLFFGVIKN